MALLSYSDMLDISKVRRKGPVFSPLPFLRLKRSCGVLSQGERHFALPFCLPQTFGKGRLVAMYAPNEPVLDYNMVIIFLMAVGTVAVGGYWAGSRDRKK